MGSNARLEIEWDAIYTAQDIGCYKPNLRNFEFMFENARRNLGVLPHEILHVAQSLTHDICRGLRCDGAARGGVHDRVGVQ
jgi:FMN phosphatase YigB (HAD superfamily)